MGRKRKKESLVEALTVLPWWVGVGMGVATFVSLRWIFPNMLPPLLKGVASTMPMFSWILLALFGIPGLISLARTTLDSTPTQRLSRESISQPEAQPEAPDSWAVEALRELEWKRFELLCAEYYEAVGFKSATIRCGADGGIDVKLFKIDPAKPMAIVQCKAWSSAVGVKEVRELLGVMAHEKVERGIFLTTSSYTEDALRFGETNPIQLLDGPAFVRKIQELPQDRQDSLLKFAFQGDYRTPTCASCGIKMVKRQGKQGAFWGCRNYPKCHSRFHIKAA